MTSPRTVLVTGAAQGLGLHMAESFAGDGYVVALADRNAHQLTEAVAQLRSRYPSAHASAMHVDVTDDASVERLVADVEASSGRLDVLVNNAGVISRGASQELSTQDWLRDLDVNVGGAFRCSRAAFRLLRASPYPSITNLGSLGSSLGMPKRASYNTSKTGVLGLTRTLAAEWGPLGIRCNAIAPGFIETAMMRSGLDSGALDEQHMLRRIPLRRLGLAPEIAAVALFLASPAASYINGATIPVDGGTTIDGTFF